MPSYIPVDSYGSVQVASGSQVQNVEVATVQTIPTGITFTWAIPSTVWEADGGAPTLDSMSQYLEGLVANNHVVGGSPSQDFDVNNLLADFVDLIVEYTNPNPNGGTLTAIASVPIASIVVFSAGAGAQGFGSGVVDPVTIVDKEYANLAAFAAG